MKLKSFINASLHVTRAVAIGGGSVVIGAFACVAVVGACTTIAGKIICGGATYFVVSNTTHLVGRVVTKPIVYVADKALE